MTPLPSLFDKIVEASKRGQQSTSLQPGSKADDSFAPQSNPMGGEHPSSDSAEDHDDEGSSYAPTEVGTEVGEESEPEPLVDQPAATRDSMDCVDTPFDFSEPLNAAPFTYGEAATSFPPSNQPHTFQYSEAPVIQ